MENSINGSLRDRKFRRALIQLICTSDIARLLVILRSVLDASYCLFLLLFAESMCWRGSRLMRTFRWLRRGYGRNTSAITSGVCNSTP